MSFVEKALKQLNRKDQESAAIGALQPLRPGPVESTGGALSDPAVSPESHGLSGTTRGRIVSVDRDRLREAGFLAPEKHQRRMADEYRRIKRPLIANAFGISVPKVPDGNLVLVSSALSGEGKTHSCINLALSIATERDITVLLVDGDTPNPQISRMFGVADQPGLLDALVDGQLGLEQLIVRTDIPHLSVLPAGRWNDHATELLASERMRALSQELANRYSGRIILIDSPPLLAATEAQAIAAVAGQAVLVIAENLTSRHEVEAALGLLDEKKPINAILNKCRQPTLGAYHYGGYGYGAHAEADKRPLDAAHG